MLDKLKMHLTSEEYNRWFRNVVTQNESYEHREKVFKTLPDMIMLGFSWRNTPEGTLYWQKIYLRLVNQNL